MKTEAYCQSCGMPIKGREFQGTDADGSPTDTYCTYCYQKGAFVQDLTMEEMIEVCVPHMVKAGMQEEQARGMLTSTLPKLDRWR